MIRTDVKTGKQYDGMNRPIGRITGCNVDGKEYIIMNESGRRYADDVWYNGMFCGDRYAVFVKAFGFWQQITPWYIRYGYAVRMMVHK